MDLKKIEKGVRLIIEGIGEDSERPGLKSTPQRVAEMYQEIFSGIAADTSALLKPMAGENHDEMVMIRDIPFFSVLRTPPAAVLREGPHRVHPGRRVRSWASAPSRGRSRFSPPAAAGAGAADDAVRRFHREQPEAQGRHGRDRRRASLHEHARRQEARLPRGDLGGAGDLPDQGVDAHGNAGSS